VVAHPDDETFGCGSLLLHATAGGAVTAVVCATRGEAGEYAGPGEVAPDRLGEIREAELRSAAAALGVSRVDLLGLTDSGMDGDAGPGTLVGEPLEQVAAAVRRVVADFRPTVLVTLDASDGHRDHERIRDAALLAAGAAPKSSVYLHCITRSLLARWLAHAQQVRPDTPYLEAGTTLGTRDDEITTVLDVAEHLPARERAIALHASQASPFAGLPDDLYRDFLAVDRLRRVRPAWRGGAQETRLFPTG
jgi:LmbE family N-acetylglucosaminyl deacetylase